MGRARTLILALLLLVAGAGAGWAQEGPDLERLRGQISSEGYNRLTAALELARQDGVPGEPLVFKALEGVAKRVPEDRILAVVERLRVNLVQAKAMLEQVGVRAPAGSAISGVASAIERGAPPDAVRATVRAGAGDNPTVALHTVADLMGRGLASDDAIAMVVAVLERGGGVPEVLALPGALDRLTTRGLPLPDAARELMQAIRAGRIPPGITIPPVGAPVPAGPPGAAGRRPPDVPTGPPGSGIPKPPIPW